MVEKHQQVPVRYWFLTGVHLTGLSALKMYAFLSALLFAPAQEGSKENNASQTNMRNHFFLVPMGTSKITEFMTALEHAIKKTMFFQIRVSAVVSPAPLPRFF
jgi:hypothetical protein